MPMEYLKEELLLLLANKFGHYKVSARRPVPMGDTKRLLYCCNF